MEKLWKNVTLQWQDSVALLLGIWLIASPWVLQFAATNLAMWNSLILGVVIAVAALSALIAFHEWEEWVNVVLGVWLLISPWVLGFAALELAAEAQTLAQAQTFAATWNFVITGLLVVCLALWSCFHMRQHDSATT